MMNIPAAPKMEPPPKGFPLPVPDIAFYVPPGLWPVWPFLYSLCKAMRFSTLSQGNCIRYVRRVELLSDHLPIKNIGQNNVAKLVHHFYGNPISPDFLL